MKIIEINKKFGKITVYTENLDDLWHLEKIIEKGDVISGKTDRKIKPSKEGEKTIRQTIFVEIKIEEINFQEFSENLKVSGIIISGHPKEFVEEKAHQSLDIKVGEKVEIKKNQIKNWQIERLKKAENDSMSSKLAVILLDDEFCEIAFINQFSINKKAKILSKKSGKQYATESDNYFEEINQKIEQLKPEKLLIAGPGFTKENLAEFLINKNKNRKIIVETTNSIGETGFTELISTGKFSKIEKDLTLSKESELIEEFLTNLAKNKGSYGIKIIKEDLENGLISKLLISEKYFMENREKCEEIMNDGEKFKTETHIITTKNPKEQIIFNFGGVVGILRYKKEEII
ncbi:MAG: mRNA surveillance protein pelota [Candidatus ainarchaeum sp.]|nr:mRNA surveillance protein pelota [Candidatus ainarchaeum sp.]